MRIIIKENLKTRNNSYNPAPSASSILFLWSMQFCWRVCIICALTNPFCALITIRKKLQILSQTKPQNTLLYRNSFPALRAAHARCCLGNTPNFPPLYRLAILYIYVHSGFAFTSYAIFSLLKPLWKISFFRYSSCNCILLISVFLEENNMKGSGGGGGIPCE